MLKAIDIYWKNRYVKHQISKLEARYPIDDWWRSAWLALANKRVAGGRIETKQEYIQARSGEANYRIRKLMDASDRIRRIVQP